MGLWRKVGPFVPTPAARGRYVLFCPPDNLAVRVAAKVHAIGQGNCPGGLVPLIKEVLGLPGDLVEVGSEVFVNRRLITHSTLNIDFANLCGLTLPRRRMLEKEGLWLMSTYAVDSFDSRYFGSVKAAQVEAFVEPLVTWDHAK